MLTGALGRLKARIPPYDPTAARLVAGAFALGALFFPFLKPATPRPSAPRDWALTFARDRFYHDQFVEWTLAAPGAWPFDHAPEAAAWVEKDGQPVPTLGDLTRMPMRADPARGVFSGRWAVPWNAPDGAYTLRIDTAPFAGLPVPSAGAFQIASRPIEPLPEGFGVLTLEGIHTLRRLRGLDGQVSPDAILDWAGFVGADAVFVQGGESGGYDRKLPADFPWEIQSDDALRRLGRACHERGLKLGVYVLSFLVGGPPRFSPGYEYGWDEEGGRAVSGLTLPKRRGISIADPRRPDDIAALLARWRDMPEVDFLGLDYIRPVFGSYELVDDFARDMPGVVLPPGWASWPRQRRMDWLVTMKYIAPSPALRGQPRYALTEQWFWYRAHRTAQVVRRITSALGDKKPVWAFTLSWQKGWEHGQDPVMMRDAGLDFDAIMLYEADVAMFRGFVGQWNRYAGRRQLNLLVGDTFDWPLHQFTLNPAGPEEFLRRNLAAAEGFHADGPARGIFLHDVYRALRGRKGPYSTEEWFLAGGAALTRLRERTARPGAYKLRLTVPPAVRPGEAWRGELALVSGALPGPVRVRLYTVDGVEGVPEWVTLSPAAPAAGFQARWRPGGGSAARGHRFFVGARAEPAPGDKCRIYIEYLQGSVPAAASREAEAEGVPVFAEEEVSP